LNGGQMAMTAWRDYFLVDLIERLATTSLELIQLCRCGDDMVNLELVATFVRCLGKTFSK